MTRLFKRVVTVTSWRESMPADPTLFEALAIGTQLTVTDLRVQFQITKSLTKHPNTCAVTISNLSTATRTWFETKPLVVKLDAGYDGEPRLMFIGDVRFAMTKESGPNWETLLQLGTGDCNHRWSRVNKSYKGGTTVRTMIKDAARSLGFALPKNIEQDPALDAQFATGNSLTGPTRDVLTRLLAPYGYHWSVQNDKLCVLRDNEVSGTEALLLDEEHGMIGTPEYGSPPKSGKPPHINVKMLLYPELEPGDLVQLRSKTKNGLFKIEHVKHHGDTHGSNWETEVEIKPFTGAASGVTTEPVEDGLFTRTFKEVRGAFTR